MIRIAIVFLALGVFFVVGGLLEETVPERVWDKLLKMMRFD